MGKRLSFQSNKSNSKTFAEFFAGIGLMRLGLEKEGWKVVFANDIDKQKEEMYRGNFSDADRHFKSGDINALIPSDIPRFNLATASFPCNDLSLAGARAGLGGTNSSAFWGFIRTLASIGHRLPRLILIENVTGFLTSRGGRDFEDAMIALNELGYAVDPFVLDAAWFVPQSRRRLFVIGVQSTTIRRIGTPPLISESPTRPDALVQFILSHPDINWRIRELPHPPKSKKRLSSIIQRLPHEADIWWSTDRAEYLLNQMSPRHRAIADKLIAAPKWSYSTVFRRVRHNQSMAELRTDGIAGCLRTPRGGSGRQILFKAGFGTFHVRLLSARECARLMGADDFKITVPLNQALFGFGDAVCVPAIRWIAKNYLNPILKEEHVTQSSSEKKTKIVPIRRAVSA